MKSGMERLTCIILFINILFARLVFCQWFLNKAISLIWGHTNLKQNRIVTNYDNLKFMLTGFAHPYCACIHFHKIQNTKNLNLRSFNYFAFPTQRGSKFLHCSAMHVMLHVLYTLYAEHDQTSCTVYHVIIPQFLLKLLIYSCLLVSDLGMI